MPRDGEVTYAAGFLPGVQADECFETLRASLAWLQPQLRMFGKTVAAPRLEAWYGDPGAAYSYSGLAHDPLPWTDALRALRERLESATAATYNSVLANLYRDGSDSNGWHADDEPELGAQPVIASISLGATRRFVLRHRASGERAEIALEAGSLLVMRGLTQECWQHSIPKQRGVQAARINLTFRRVAVRG